MVNVTPTSLRLRQRLAAVGIVACVLAMAFGLCQMAGLGGVFAQAVPAIFTVWLVLAAVVWLLAVIITELESSQLIVTVPVLRLKACTAGLLSRFTALSPPPPRLVS